MKYDFKDFKFENVRKVLRGHWMGALAGGVLGYFLYRNYQSSITFAITPLESALSFVQVQKESLITISLIVALGAFIGAFIQARGMY